jgi:RNA polymerase sigma factor (TIGR02999 family)
MSGAPLARIVFSPILPLLAKAGSATENYNAAYIYSQRVENVILMARNGEAGLSMGAPYSQQITGLLRAWGAGDELARDQLVPLLHRELKRIAKSYMRRERTGHTLQPTALVNEAFLRLVDVHDVQWQDRAHFFAVAAQIMRRILVNHALARGAGKRGGGLRPAALDEALVVSPERDSEIVALDEALEALAKRDPRKAQVVDLRFFGGLSVEETAAVLKVSEQTVLRDWRLSKSWLAREMSGAVAD